MEFPTSKIMLLMSNGSIISSEDKAVISICDNEYQVHYGVSKAHNAKYVADLAKCIIPWVYEDKRYVISGQLTVHLTFPLILLESKPETVGCDIVQKLLEAYRFRINKTVEGCLKSSRESEIPTAIYDDLKFDLLRDWGVVIDKSEVNGKKKTYKEKSDSYMYRI